ncbi:MAG: radical SAM protein [Candidatus Woesearchaeota archaeon]
MNILIINPNIVTQKGDFFGTGIPYMPIIPAYIASYLISKGHHISIIDAFGENPFKSRVEKKEFIIQGLNYEEIVAKVNNNKDLICIYAGHVVEHFVITNIIRKIKEKCNTPICIIENSQAVTAYSVKIAHKEFIDAGAEFVIYGEPEYSIDQLLSGLKKGNVLKTPGLIYKNKEKIIINPQHISIKNLDELPFPAWDLYPIKNYWKIGYSHAPFNGKYIVLLTSRGCPFACEFCVIPFTNERKWRARSAKNVLNEIIYWKQKLGISDFHIEDLNPTVDKKRTKELCQEIMSNNLDITFKFASGIKLETLDEESMLMLKKAGCNYLSFSPETGSSRMLKLMNKPFNYEHGIKMTKLMHKLNIKMQACFVIGFPGENKEDRILTKEYISKLTKAGVDEIALFAMTPVPGSKPYESGQHVHQDLSKLTFTPKWRKEYKTIDKFRKEMYLMFFILKTIYHPIKVLKQGISLIKRKFDTKIEMTVYRLIKTYL